MNFHLLGDPLPRMRFPEEIEHYYIQDMPLLRKETLYKIYHTYMEQYRLKDEISKTTATVMVWYGSKEMKCVKQSAQMLKELVPSCRIYGAKGCCHGYLAIYLPDEWLKIVIPFLNDSSDKVQETETL
jgi:hypothetical protein